MTDLTAMTFNVLFGAWDQERFPRILSLLDRHRPDLLVLQECLNWDERRLAQVADVLKAEHTQLGQARARGSGKRYHVAAVSRFPIHGVRVHNDPHFIGHCLLEFHLDLGARQHVRVFGTHWDAHNENLRFVEARYLRSLLPPTFGRERCLLLGDLNSLSRRDPYPDDLEQRLRQAGTSKYHFPPRFDVIDELENYGWLDTLYWRQQPRFWVTARRDRGGVHIEYRTDYIFASPAMAANLVETRVLQISDESDHAPVLSRFQLP